MLWRSAQLRCSSARAEATNIDRLVLDGCEVGGRGNDIHSLQSHYDPKRDEMVVTLRLCAKAQPKATYRVYLDHTAPFVGRTAASAACATTADSVVAQTPSGHKGVGTSQIKGDTVRFVIPLAKLHVGKPKDVPLIPIWATSTLGDTTDRAPNRETGDGCEHPRATTETLVQARVAVTGLAFVSSYSFTGAIGPSSIVSINVADATCQQQAANAGITNTSGIHAWLSNAHSQPSNYGDPFFGPIQTADGTVVAANISTLSSCDQSGDACLQAPINKDVQGNPVTDDNFAWTGTFPDGTTGGGEAQDCNAWTSDSASDNGDGGNTGQTAMAGPWDPRTAVPPAITSIAFSSSRSAGRFTMASASRPRTGRVGPAPPRSAGPRSISPCVRSGERADLELPARPSRRRDGRS